MPGLASRSVPFQTGCEMLGLHKEPDDKIKTGLLVNRAKLIYAATTLSIFALVVCLTVLSITSQKGKTIPGIQVTNIIEEDVDPSGDSNDNSTSSETSTEALKYLIVSHPRRSKSVDVPPWYRPQPTSYGDGSYAQLETYRNSKKVHSVSDILRYMHGERNAPVKLKGVWVKGPMNSDVMKPPYHTDNMNKFNPTHPSDISVHSTKGHPNHGSRFSNKFPRPTIGPFKPLPEYPSHTQAIFHPYSLENNNEENVKSNHKLKSIGSSQEADERTETPLKPFSVLLDIYPVAGTTPKPKDRTKIIRNKGVPLKVTIPSLTHVHIRPARPTPPTPKPTPQRMLLHLNLYPKKRNKNRNNGKVNIQSELSSSSLETELNEEADKENLFGEFEDESKLTPVDLLSEAKLSNFSDTRIKKRILSWCNHYEDDLVKEKSVFFITILRSFCQNFDSREIPSESTELKTNQGDETTYIRFAKLTQAIENATEYPSNPTTNPEVVDNGRDISSSLLVPTLVSEKEGHDKKEDFDKVEKRIEQVTVRKQIRRRGRTRFSNNVVNSTEYLSQTLLDTTHEPPPPSVTEPMSA